MRRNMPRNFYIPKSDRDSQHDESKEDLRDRIDEAMSKFLKSGGKIKKVRVTAEFIKESLKPKKRKYNRGKKTVNSKKKK